MIDLSVYPMMILRIISNAAVGIIPLYFCNESLVGDDSETKDLLYRGIYILCGLCLIFSVLSAELIFNVLRKAKFEEVGIDLPTAWLFTWSKPLTSNATPSTNLGGEAIPVKDPELRPQDTAV